LSRFALPNESAVIERPPDVTNASFRTRICALLSDGNETSVMRGERQNKRQCIIMNGGRVIQDDNKGSRLARTRIPTRPPKHENAVQLEYRCGDGGPRCRRGSKLPRIHGCVLDI